MQLACRASSYDAITSEGILNLCLLLPVELIAALIEEL